MKTTVYKRTAQYDQLGRRLPDDLHESPEQISAGLATRLQRYAEQCLLDAGFTQQIEWSAQVYTMDAADKPADRAYTVRFLNDKGGYVEVIGILTKHGWPSLDHGFAIGQEI